MRCEICECGEHPYLLDGDIVLYGCGDPTHGVRVDRAAPCAKCGKPCDQKVAVGKTIICYCPGCGSKYSPVSATG